MTDLSQESPLWREWAESRHSVQQMREELDRLRAELEIARNDAERYRWLRRRIRIASEQMMTGAIKKCLTVRVAYSVMDRTDDPADSYLSKDRFDADCATLDAAIDNARGGK
jgi:hypothetical protein